MYLIRSIISEHYESRTKSLCDLRIDNHLQRTNTIIVHFGNDFIDYTNVEVSSCDVIPKPLFVDLFLSTIDSSVNPLSVNDEYTRTEKLSEIR